MIVAPPHQHTYIKTVVIGHRHLREKRTLLGGPFCRIKQVHQRGLNNCSYPKAVHPKRMKYYQQPHFILSHLDHFGFRATCKGQSFEQAYQEFVNAWAEHERDRLPQAQGIVFLPNQPLNIEEQTRLYETLELGQALIWQCAPPNQQWFECMGKRHYVLEST